MRWSRRRAYAAVLSVLSASLWSLPSFAQDGAQRGLANAVPYSDCDFFLHRICVRRPSPDYFVSVTELGRGFHGDVIKVTFYLTDQKDHRRIVVILNEFLELESATFPSCLAPRQPWCKKVLYSADYIFEGAHPRPPGHGHDGMHIDVIEAPPGVDLRNTLRNVFLPCHRVGEVSVCDLQK
jgi:hypothetical protein